MNPGKKKPHSLSPKLKTPITWKWVGAHINKQIKQIKNKNKFKKHP
jgi:hypothetical protein